MKNIKIKCPAKINLTLKILGARNDGYHEIESIMQTIGLYDYLDINVKENSKNEIILAGDCDDILYDSSNLVYKAADKFLQKSKITNKKLEIFIEKNIPVAAGLAGGSSDAAGTLYGLNKIFDNILSEEELNKICAELGSDLNACLTGGSMLCKGRGEKIIKHKFNPHKVSLIKPKNLGISAKEAYEKFSSKPKTKELEFEKNDLEWAIIGDYPQLQYIKNKYSNSIMTGSGSTFYLIDSNFEPENDYIVINDLNFTDEGVSIA